MDETLCAIRDRIESLATPTGDYYIVCGQTGQQPVPIDGTWFPDRETAAEAAQTATAYRAALREYDQRTPVHDFVVCQQVEDRLAGTPVTAESAGQRREGDA
ncbi:DUF7552 domain-containing protein [Salinibaculum salinum]|uniref:DUF7552 domain-containing protein n=1 Tax=Salinibaculum salinum TaxID=3131996 RepID=UPI0030ECE239